MRQRRLNCFEAFHCLAGQCSDTCCAGWEIDLDPEILDTYAALPGTLGEEVRSLIAEEDGYTFFRCQDGRCPFLDDHLLCRLITAADGQQCLLSEVCREHPRFHEEYGTLRETCLAISCPEAARLLLESGPVRSITESSPEPGEPLDASDAALTAMLEAEREQVFRLIAEDLPVEKRLERLMACAPQLQRKLDVYLEAEANGALPGEIPGILEKMELPEAQQSPDLPEPAQDLRPWLKVMQRMEFTDDRLPVLLERALARSGPLTAVIPEAMTLQAENLLYYFLYRYFLKALWDEDLLSKICFAVRSVQTIFLLAPETGLSELSALSALEEAAVRYSREVEHSDENIELLYDEIWQNMQCGAGYS